MSRDYVFVVGLPRTGSKLVRDVLHSSPTAHYKISDETFFLGHFIRRGVCHQLKRYGDLSIDSNVARLVRDMYAGQFRGTYWSLLVKGRSVVSQDTLEELLLASDRSPRAVYSSLMQAYPEVTVDTVVGDKTPGNLYHVPEIFEWYPEAKVIHTFRDPRAILASEWKKRTEEDAGSVVSAIRYKFHTLIVFLHVAVTWLYAVRIHGKYQAEYGDRYCLVKFEDLVSQPAASTRLLCDFLGIEFCEEMLAPEVFDSSYTADENRVSVGFDTSTLTRWKKHLPPLMSRSMTFLTGRYLKRFGYEL